MVDVAIVEHALVEVAMVEAAVAEVAMVEDALVEVATVKAAVAEVAMVEAAMVELAMVEVVKGCLRFTKFCWVGKHANIIMKPMNSPTQGQPNPRKIRLKVAFGPLFPTRDIFWWVGIDFISETDCEKPNPTTFSANTV